jgi:hypothetical protein
MPIRDPNCPVCSKAIKAGSLVLFQHGELFHFACMGRVARMRSIELGDRAARARARAAQNVERAAELVEAASRLRERRCAVCRRPRSEPVHIRCSDRRAP